MGTLSKKTMFLNFTERILFLFYLHEFQSAQDKLIDNDSDENIRFRQIYLGNHDRENDLYDKDCNPAEIA